MVTKILDSILAIEDYGETHRMLRLCGIKIKFPKREYAKKRKENPYYYYKENNIDITTIPPATGQIRDIQLANLALLKEFDFVCRENGLQYWLDSGTLLGAVRHKGFVPWDDDIDVAMLREDYEKVIKAFEASSRNPDIYASYVRDKKDPSGITLKVQHKRCEHLFVDIFPFDNYGKTLSEDEQIKITEEYKKERKNIKKCVSFADTNDELFSKLKKLRHKFIQTNKTADSDIVCGSEFAYRIKNWFFKNDTIFPLKDIEYENIRFMSVNKPEVYLSNLYKNYMLYPSKIGYGHSSYITLSETDLKIIKDLGGIK